MLLPGVGPLRSDSTFVTVGVSADLAVEEAYEHARLTGLVLRAAMRERAAAWTGWPASARCSGS